RSYATSSDFVRTSAAITPPVRPLTIAGWFYFTSTPTYGAIAVFAAQFGIFVKSTGKMAYFTGSSSLDPASLTANTNAWNHAALVMPSGGVNAQGYLNGAADGATIPNTSDIASNSFSSGTDTGNENLVGRTADIAIWSAALTASEISALNAGAR